MPCLSLLPLLEQEGGSATARPPSHGSRPGVRRMRNLACHPDHDPLLLLIPSRPGPHPCGPPSPRHGSRALSCYFVPSALFLPGLSSKDWPAPVNIDKGSSMVRSGRGRRCKPGPTFHVLLPGSLSSNCRQVQNIDLQSDWVLLWGAPPQSADRVSDRGWDCLTRVLDATAWKNALEESNLGPACLPISGCRLQRSSGMVTGAHTT